MAGDLLFLENPRRRRIRRRRRKFLSLIRRRRRNPFGEELALSNPVGEELALANPRRTNIMATIIPVGIGVGAGLIIPKVFKLSGIMKWVAPIAGGLAISTLGKNIFGRRTANLIATGMISSVVIQALDEILFKKQGYQVLAQDEEEPITISELEQDEEIPELTAGEITDIPTEELKDVPDEELKDLAYSRFE